MWNTGPSTILCVFMGFLSTTFGRNIPGRDVFSTEELREYSRDGSAIQEFDIISPQFISNGVFKRSAESIDSFQPSTIKEVQYEAFDRRYSLQLDRNDWLIRKGLQVEILKADGTLERRPLKVPKECHYFGRIAEEEKSAVAISLCNGLHGMVSHNDTDFIIQPLKKHHADRLRSRRDVDDNPHIIYKRTTPTRPREDEEVPQEQHRSFCSYEAPVGYHPTAMPYLRPNRGPSAISQPLPYVGQKYLELFVVADKDMVEFHGNDTEDYVFALMNVVSRRYADPSLDITLRIHIVKFMLLETDNPMLRSSSFAVTGSSATLDEFCAWQSNINPIQDSHPEHWDNAILLTRKNIYTSLIHGRDDSLLGKAYLSSTCRRGLQCSYNQDDGLGSSLVIAHETGHTLGLNHDDDYGCISGMNIMSSWRPAGPDSFTWSECSRQNIRTFLGGPVATCLDDVPSNSPLPVDTLSGAAYDMGQQCVLALGHGAETCQQNFVNCGYLRCRNDTGCFSLGVGVMDGTSCGVEQWCLSGSCVDMEPLPAPIDGGWSEWGQTYGDCSRTCGGGVRMRRRYCTNPRPQYGGSNCVGPAEQYQACNLQLCESNQDEYRDQQCSQTDDTPFNGHNYTWKAFTTGQIGDDLCTKKCLSSSNFWATRPPYQYVDGTRCWHSDATDMNSFKLCVSGKCRSFGCDGVQGSSRVFDVCRECDGDGSSCEQITGRYDGGRYRKHTSFLEIPVGATSIQITNANLAYTHMAVSTEDGALFQGYLFTPPSAGRYGAGNSIVKYSPDFTSFRETIFVEGPTSVPLTIRVYLLYDPNAIYGVDVKPKITYRYHVPIDQSIYEWMAGQYGECSVTCGEGVQTRPLRCARIHNNRPKEVDDSRCDTTLRPPTTLPCDQGPCPAPAEWMKGSWSECDAECGDGLQTREVKCQRGEVLAPGECDGEKPRDTRECSVEDCGPSPEWVVGSWSECDVACGTGVQRRKVECWTGNSLTLGDCDVSTELEQERSCDAGACPEWVPGDWGECNVPCGYGIKHRTATCEQGGVVVHKSECNPELRPRSKSPCQQSPCVIPAEWVSGPWSRCDAQCGTGEESRFVVCREGKLDVDAERCDASSRPDSERECILEPCPPVWETGSWSECSVTCGEGVQIREVTCELMGNPATRRNCNREQKPAKIQQCSVGPCALPAEWVFGNWSECSQTCGEGGIRVRSVQCQSGDNPTPGDCDLDNMPIDEETCFAAECPLPALWTASSWSECNATCGDGFQSRDVKCQRGRESVDDSECDREQLPVTRQNCNLGVCPTLPPTRWVIGDWSECSATCGNVYQSRDVRCQVGDEVVDDIECDQAQVPVARQNCNVNACPTLPLATWVIGDWSECSATCGDGYQSRDVRCQIGDDNAEDIECNQAQVPVSRQDCNDAMCPTLPPAQWVIGDWSECSATCGDSYQSRDVRCQIGDENVENIECNSAQIPVARQDCNAVACPTQPPATWVIGEWSKCTATCGNGHQTRDVTCQIGDESVDNSECGQAHIPDERQECNTAACPTLSPAKWVIGEWSKCSATCGDGHQSRDISCQIGDESVEDTKCDQTHLPDTRQECNIVTCPTQPPARWVAGEWTECDASCGHGTQERTVTCERDGETTDGECSVEDKPDTERSCDAEPCVVGEDVNPEEVCNQLIEAPTGSYTQSHPTGTDGCTTTLVAPPGKSFSLRINSLINCDQGEYLKIIEGTRERNICGQQTDHILNYRDNVLSIIVKTVSSESGYALTFERRDGRAADRCDRLFLTTSGTIKSPAYPRRYPSNADCRYRIVTPPGTRIRISFSRFMMQGTYPTCRYDKLEIIDTIGRNGYTYCGTRNQFSIVSTGNELLLRLRTDSRTNLSGFRATYTVR